MNAGERKIFEFAYNLTQSAGHKLKEERKNSIIRMNEKTSHTDIVTNHDLMIDEYISEAIRERYPQHSILSEESCGNSSTCPMKYKWVIDPIDGTINYFRSGANYAISVALYNNREPVFGLIYDVGEERMYSAGKGEYAMMNGDRLKLDRQSGAKLNEAIVAMSLRTMIEFTSLGMDVFDYLSRMQAHRYMGCASLELCKVAYGQIDLYLSSNVYEWDISAARVIVEQSGGTMIVKENRSRSGKLFVAAYHSSILWEEMLKLFPGNIRNAFGY